LAILVGVTTDLCEHKLLAARSVILTWAVLIAWVESTWTMYLWVDQWVYAHQWVSPWVNSSGPIFEFWVPFGGGLCLVWCAGSAVSGWMNARSSGGNRAAMVAATMLPQVPLSLWWTRHFWLYGEFSFSWPPRFWVPNYLWATIVLIGMPTSTILGGLWSADDVPSRPPDE
jgi:hypothetical protein